MKNKIIGTIVLLFAVHASAENVSSEYQRAQKAETVRRHSAISAELQANRRLNAYYAVVEAQKEGYDMTGVVVSYDPKNEDAYYLRTSKSVCHAQINAVGGNRHVIGSWWAINCYAAE